MLTFDQNYAPRIDGRCTASLAACFARLRALRPELAYTGQAAAPDTFRRWKEAVRKRLKELIRMPECPIPQPPPRLLESSPRKGYTLETWELYPDPWSAVPFFLLRPESVSAPRPAVLCIPGSHHAKEVLAGEPLPANPNCVPVRFPERNQQALHMVRAGYIALAFDNPGTAGLAEADPDGRESQWGNRRKLVQAYLDMGTTYTGVSVYQKMLVLDWLVRQPGTDPERIAVCGHSLGSEAAMVLGVLDDRISAVIFNDFLCDERTRFMAVTEAGPEKLDDGGNWHQIPGIWSSFGFPDLLAALAPKMLSINEGGAEEFLDKVRNSYRLSGAGENLAVHYYPFAENLPKLHEPVPDHGLTEEEFFRYSSVCPEDHSFRAEHSLNFLKKAWPVCPAEEQGTVN